MVALNSEMVEGDSKSHESASEKLEAIAGVVSECRKCPLADTRTNTVPGEGSSTAEIMFVGEGPGRDEDLSGRPFVGRAGKFLDELIESLPMRREDVYITNVVKCRPPGNRDPERSEVDQCSGYLRQQIAAIDPLVIVPLGRHALGWFNPNLRITASNGKIFRHEDRVLMPLLHPSAGLRSTSNAEMLREGIHNLREAILEGIRVKREAIEEPMRHPVEESSPRTIEPEPPLPWLRRQERSRRLKRPKRMPTRHRLDFSSGRRRRKRFRRRCESSVRWRRQRKRLRMKSRRLLWMTGNLRFSNREGF